MDNNHTDLRIIKTKEAIKNALLELIDEYPFEEITVSDLTKRANINRGTFYLHYKNIEGLMDEYFDDFITKFYASIEDDNLGSEEGWYYPVVEPISPFMINLLNFIKENRKLFRLLWITQGNIYYQIKLKHFVRNILFYNDNALINKKDLLVPEIYYTSYVFSSFMGVVKQWLDVNCEEATEEIAEILSTLNSKGVFIASGSQQTK